LELKQKRDEMLLEQGVVVGGKLLILYDLCGFLEVLESPVTCGKAGKRLPLGSR